MNEVEELHHFCTQPRRNWTAKVDVFNERGVIVAGRTMVVLYTPQVLAENGKVYKPTMAYEEMLIKVIVEYELKGES